MENLATSKARNAGAPVLGLPLLACNPLSRVTRQIRMCMQFCGALLFPAQCEAAAVEACLAASISHPSVALPLLCHACLHSHRCCCADQSLAGCTPYSLHSAEQTATGYEAKEFHLQQVHKPLPDKVSAGVRTLSCMPACASMWHWRTSCRCAAGSWRSAQHTGLQTCSAKSLMCSWFFDGACMC